jgi:Type VI immunity for VRR-NUC
MPPLSLPAPLARPIAVSQTVVAKVMLDLTVYLTGPSVDEFDYLVNLYDSICPRDRLVKYKISELEFWPRIANPVLTTSGRSAAAAGVRHPYFEPARERIRQGRAFESQFWDGREIGDPEGSWSFSCRSLHLRSSGLHAFAGILLPLTADPEILRTAALALADNVGIYSGHGGLAFVYDTWHMGFAFDAIYALARRFWGVDVEHMNGTLALMRDGIKAVNWITLVGQKFASIPEVQTGLGALATTPNVTIDQRKHAAVIVAGPQPVPGDQHRPDHSLDPYYAVANALKSLSLDAHPDFPSERWVKAGNTVGWIRRFIDPGGWS